MDGSRIGSTDASGQLGRRVARRLAEAGCQQTLVAVEDGTEPEQVPLADVRLISSYDDGSELTAALRGVGTLFLVPIRERVDRAEVQRRMVDAALEAGVVRIVYSSFLSAAPDAVFTFARDHYATEKHIRASGIPFTIVRGGPFHEVVPWLVGPDGVIRGPPGRRRRRPGSRDAHPVSRTGSSPVGSEPTSRSLAATWIASRTP